MNKPGSSPQTLVIARMILAVLAVLPVSGMVTSGNPASATTTTGTYVISASTPSYYVTASVTTGTPVVGDPVTIFGTAAGDTLPAAVQIWVFAGNYVNVTTVPVDVAGDFSETFSTTGLLPATYFVFVESPGPNSDFNIDLAESGGFAGQVVNMATNSLIFNLTGTGSLKNENASRALSEAFSDPEVDDVYTKLTFQLSAPNTTTAITPSSTPPVPTSTARSPLAEEMCGLAMVISGLVVVKYRKK